MGLRGAREERKEGMDFKELTENEMKRVARRLREYAVFLENAEWAELGEYEWDLPVFQTTNEILVHLQDILEEFEE